MYLQALRQLVDQQQHTALRDQALLYFTECEDPQALPLAALAHGLLGDRDEAYRLAQQAKNALHALDQDARIDLAAVLGLLLQLDQAVELLQAALAEQPDHPLALARLAWCRVQQGRLAEARPLYQRSAELAPHRLPVWVALARLQMQLGQSRLAQQALDCAIDRLEATLNQLPETVITEFTTQLRELQLEIWVGNDRMAQAEQWLEQRQLDLPESEWCWLIAVYASFLARQDQHAEADEALRGALKHYPKNIELVGQLAELAQLQGRTYQAVQLLRRCIALVKRGITANPRRELQLWLRLFNTCLPQMTDQAERAVNKACRLLEQLESADELNADEFRQLRLQTLNAQAQLASQHQNYKESQRLFEAVLEEAPYFVPALQGFGQQQLQCGNIDAAVALFERLKQVDPAKGYSALINARRFPEDRATLEKIERAARQPSLEGAVRSGLLLQLASAWEKRKEYDRAFALAVEANEASKKHLSYDPHAHRNQCARIRHAFCKALYEHRADCGYRGEDESLPVFVLGMPRSGTTLVEQILAGHSQIVGAGELGVIPSRIAGLNRWERHTGSGRRYPDCIDDLTPYITSGIAKGILDELKALAAEDKPEAGHVVDKLPHNFENVGLIKFLFPRAKIISVRRDPRDIAISNFFTDYQAKHGGMGFAYDLTWIGEQLADHNLMMQHWKELFPGEILEINYEDVVGDLEGSARRMLDYIGVAWEPQVLAFNELERPVKTASVWQVRQPVYKTSTAKWKRYQAHLSPLIQGTNAKITWDPIEDMLTLPVPGLLTEGVDLFEQRDLDGAELNFKKLLHHNPGHAAANYMLGLVYCHKNHLEDAIPLFERALDSCPWRREWRDNLIKAYAVTGDREKADALQARNPGRAPQAEFSALSGGANGQSHDRTAGSATDDDDD